MADRKRHTLLLIIDQTSSLDLSAHVQVLHSTARVISSLHTLQKNHFAANLNFCLRNQTMCGKAGGLHFPVNAMVLSLPQSHVFQLSIFWRLLEARVHSNTWNCTCFAILCSFVLSGNVHAQVEHAACWRSSYTPVILMNDRTEAKGEVDWCQENMHPMKETFPPPKARGISVIS